MSEVVRCNLKGCRGPELSGQVRYVLRSLCRLRDAEQAVLGRRAGVDVAETLAFFGRLQALLQSKLAWVDQLPYFVWQVSSPETARQFLDMHDDVLRAGSRPHRVAAVFAGRQRTSLRRDMEAFALGRPMSASLRTELLSYRLCLHRNVSHEARRVPHASLPHLASSLRRRQNLNAWESLPPSVRRNLWASWKSVAERLGRRRRAFWRLPRLRPRDVIREVYRLGQVPLRPPVPAELALQARARALPQRAPSLAVLLQQDFLRVVLQEGGVFSVPVDVDDLLGDANVDVLAAAAAVESARPSCVFFQVVDANPGRKKHVETQWLRDVRRMVLPMALQRLRVSGDVPGGVLLEAEGAAGVEDVAVLASWRALRCCLRHWGRPRASASTVAPAALFCPDGDLVVRRTWPFRSSGVPVCVVLDALLQEGWISVGRERKVLTPGGVRTFRGSDPIRRRAYLQCLVVLPSLFEAGLRSLTTNQGQGYYWSLLASDAPASVPLLAVEAAGDIQTRPEVLELEEEGRGDVGDVPVLKRRRKSRPEDHWESVQAVLWRRPDPDAAVVISGEEERPAVEEVVPAPRGRRPSVADPFLEGVRVVVEQHEAPGEREYYRRLVVRCPACSERHREVGRPACCKRRNCGPKTMAVHGELEPWAYLGVWLAAAGRLATRSEHQAFRPSRRDVAAYIAAQGWAG